MIGAKSHIRRRRPEAMRSLAFAAACAVLRFVLAEAFEARSGRNEIDTSVVVGLAAGVMAWGLMAICRRFPSAPPSVPGAASGTISTHRVSIEHAGNRERRDVLMNFETDALAISGTFSFHDEIVPYAEIESIHERPAGIELRFADGVARVIPESFQARKDLLWAFAVNCNAALDHGIDLDEVALAAEPVPARTVSTEDAVLGSGVPGLGSALAGPMDRGNIAPPRKSGLGVGLFPSPGDAG